MRLKRNKGFKNSEKRHRIQYYKPKGDCDELQDKITSVSKMAPQEKGRQLNESIELTDPLNKRIEEILKVKGEASSLTSYPSSESLQEFESDEIDLGQYWYYAIKAEQIKKKMDQATKAFHERDEYYRDPKLYDSFYAEYTKHFEKLHQQLKTVDEILSKQKLTLEYMSICLPLA